MALSRRQLAGAGADPDYPQTTITATLASNPVAGNLIVWILFGADVDTLAAPAGYDVHVSEPQLVIASKIAVGGGGAEKTHVVNGLTSGDYCVLYVYEMQNPGVGFFGADAASAVSGTGTAVAAVPVTATQYPTLKFEVLARDPTPIWAGNLAAGYTQADGGWTGGSDVILETGAAGGWKEDAAATTGGSSGNYATAASWSAAVVTFFLATPPPPVLDVIGSWAWTGFRPLPYVPPVFPSGIVAYWPCDDEGAVAEEVIGGYDGEWVGTVPLVGDLKVLPGAAGAVPSGYLRINQPALWAATIAGDFTLMVVAQSPSTAWPAGGSAHRLMRGPLGSLYGYDDSSFGWHYNGSDIVFGTITPENETVVVFLRRTSSIGLAIKYRTTGVSGFDNDFMGSPSSNPDAAAALGIGGFGATADNYWPIKLAGIGLWQRALTEPEMAAAAALALDDV